MHQSLQGATFHVEHVRPRSKGGASDLANLAWSCPGCNLYKSSRTTAVDPATGTPVSLFDPRTDVWADHFAFSDVTVVGLTPKGRATALALHFNDERRQRIREAERLFGLFPP